MKEIKETQIIQNSEEKRINKIENKEKIVSLQSLRALAFIGIFLLHAGSTICWPELGVTIFFVMSGFLMIYTYINKELNISFKDNFLFSIKKIKKLYLLHILTTLLCFLVMVLNELVKGFTVYSLIKLVGKLCLNIFLVQTWIPVISVNFSLNGVAWYLSVTVFLYFMFPFILKKIRKIKSNKQLIIYSIMILFIQYAISLIFLNAKGLDGKLFKYITYICPLYRLGDFIIGCNIGFIFVNSKMKKISKFKSTILEILCLIICIFAIIFSKQQQNIYWLRGLSENLTIIYIPISIMLILLFINCNGILTKLLNNRFLIYIGNISAYTFLIHYAITEYISKGINFLGINLMPELKACIILLEFILTILITILYLKIKKIKVSYK